MKKKRSRAPKFKNDTEAAEYFERHSGESEWKASKPVKMTFRRPIKHMLSIRMELELFEKLYANPTWSPSGPPPWLLRALNRQPVE